MIIGLMGAKGSGKDTVAAYLIQQHGFERRAFADKLKQSVSALFGITFEQIERFKNDEFAVVILQLEKTVEWSFSFREFLQLYGTESHRDVFGTDFWLDQCLPADGFYSGRAIVVTDMRFVNEIDRVKSLGGYVVRVDRPSLGTKDGHRSEQEWQQVEPDYVITNGASIDYLYASVETMLEALYERAS